MRAPIGMSVAVLLGCEAKPQPSAKTESAEAPLFDNNGFETGDLSNGTLSTALVAVSPGVQVYPVTLESQLGLRAGGPAKTNVRFGAVGTLIPPGFSSAEIARYPRVGSSAAVVNEQGSSDNANRNTVRVIENGEPVCEALVTSEGAWRCVGTFSEAGHEVSAVLVDTRGFVSAPSTEVEFTVDLTAPLAPTWTAPSADAWLTESRPLLSGTGEPGASVIVSSDGAALCEAIVAIDGSWSCIPSRVLPDGVIALSLLQRDAASNESPAVPRSVRIDTLFPEQPTLSAPAMGALVSSTTPTLSGMAEPFSTVRVFVDGLLQCETVANALGSYSCVPPHALTEGPHAAEAFTTEAAGNQSAHVMTSFDLDSIKPGTPVITGPSGMITNPSPRLEGNAEAGSSLSVWLDGALVCTVVADAQGQWSCAVPAPLSVGQHAMRVSARDATGNVSPEVSQSFDVQTAAGTMNPPGDLSSTDNGHLSGTGTPGATVNVYVDGRLVGTVVVGADGNWSCDLPLMTAGAHSVSIGITGSADEEVFRSGDETVVVSKPDTDFGGGIGCSSTSQAPMSLLALLAMVLASKRRALRKAAVAVSVLGAVVATQASAQVAVSNFELEQLNLNPSARGGLVVGGADLLAPRDFRVAAFVGYENSPLKYFENGLLKATLVEHRVTASVSAAASVLPWLELGATVPVVLYQSGNSAMSRSGDVIMGAVPSNVSLGTPWLQGRVGVLQERSGAPLDLGFTVMMGLPMGSGASLTREKTVSGEVLVGAGRTLGPVRIAAEAGAHLREQAKVGSGSEAIGSRLLGSLGVSTVGAAFRAEISARAFVPLTAQPVSAELLAGVRYAVKDFEFFALAGPGLGNAPGTPVFRALLGVSFGGVPNALCSGRMQELACPRQDFDGDGIANADDLCPEEAANSANGCAVVKVAPPVVVAGGAAGAHSRRGGR